MSDYQAEWITYEKSDSEESDAEESEAEDEYQMDDIPFEEKEENEDGDGEDYETMTVSEVPVDNDRYDQEMDVEEEKNALEMLKQAKDDLLFPDEIDTPMDQTARLRFKKYRGMESFR